MKFYPKDHKYIHEGISYPSASAIIEAYFGKFRKYDAAGRYAKKHNIRKSKVLKDWADKAKKATTIGTLIHEYAETQVSGENHEYMAKTTREKEIIQDNKDKIEELKKNTDSVIKKIKKKFPDYEYTTEMILFSEKLKLAGTADLVLKKEEKVVILDYKTSKEISQTPFAPKSPRSYTHPVCFPNSNFFKYSVQTGIYGLLYKTTQDQDYIYKYKDIDFETVHIPPYLNFNNVCYNRPYPFPLSDEFFIVHIPTERIIPCIKIPEELILKIIMIGNPFSRTVKHFPTWFFAKYKNDIKITKRVTL